MFEEGQIVELRSLLWRVKDCVDLGAYYVLTLEGYEETNHGLIIKVITSENIERPHIREIDKLELGFNIQPLSSWRIFMDAMKLSFRQPMNVFTTLINSKIRIEDYQFVPLVKILELHTPRILIADDVGLGKTIEAGIILQELASRNLGNKVLIVVPAALQIQWRDELVVRLKRNPYRYKSLYEMLTNLIEKYNVKLLTTAEVIEELVKLAKEIKKAADEGKKLNLTEEEMAFYDLLASEEGLFENYDEIVRVAKDIVKQLGYYVKVADWNKKEYLKAKLRAAVKRVLIRVVDGRVSYKLIDKLSWEIINQAEVIYASPTS